MAGDFLQTHRCASWLDGAEPAWTLLTGESRALRQEPSAIHTAIRIANNLTGPDEIAASAVARNTFTLLRHAIERGGLPLTATGNLSRAVVAEMRNFI